MSGPETWMEKNLWALTLYARKQLEGTHSHHHGDSVRGGMMEIQEVHLHSALKTGCRRDHVGSCNAYSQLWRC